MSVAPGRDGRVLLRCFAGCEFDAIVAALGLEKAEFAPPREKSRSRRAEIVTTYPYRDEAGALLFEVLRYSPKSFRQRRPDGRGGWVWNLDGVRRVPYRLPELVDAVRDGRTIFLVEGEKDADALVKLGEAATTFPGGAGKWRPEYAAYFAGAAEVVVVADADEPGRKHARTVFDGLRAVVEHVVLAEPAAGKDASDHLLAGKALDDLEVDDEARRPPDEAGAELLDDVAAFIRRYVAFPSDAAADAVALWVAHTWTFDRFDSTPRLAILSPVKGSGKTRLIEVLGLLVRDPLHTVNATAPVIFRLVDERAPTLLFDETDAIFGPTAASAHEELRALLNAGHRRGAYALRIVGEGASMVPKEFQAFAPAALAGLGSLPDTILHRSVVLHMRRRAPDEIVEPFRFARARAAADPLRDRLAAWAARHGDALEGLDPVLPDGVVDRPADVWAPLVAIADLAGGAWPDRARAACVELVADASEADASLGVRLLADIRTVMDGQDRVRSADLAAALAALEDAPWGDLRGKPLDARGLAWRLAPFGIRPHLMRFSDGPSRGYDASDFLDAWARYLPRNGCGNGAIRYTPSLADANVPSDLGCNDVTLVTAPGGQGGHGARALFEPLEEAAP